MTELGDIAHKPLSLLVIRWFIKSPCLPNAQTLRVSWPSPLSPSGRNFALNCSVLRSSSAGGHAPPPPLIQGESRTCQETGNDAPQPLVSFTWYHCIELDGREAKCEIEEVGPLIYDVHIIKIVKISLLVGKSTSDPTTGTG